jgi:hypothetical protein
MNSSIVASGTKFDIGCRVILWDEAPFYSFYPNKKFIARNLTLNDLKKQINGICLHHSVTYNAKQTYVALVGRGLSVNFTIDDDVNEDGCATIYQHLDIKDGGYSQAPHNDTMPGVEISYHPQRWQTPSLYNEKNVKAYNVQPHEEGEDKVHNVTLKIFKPTNAQVLAAAKLAAGMSNIFEFDLKFPRDKNGEIYKTEVPNELKKGLINHFHITRNKIDPVGIDLLEFERIAEEEKNKQIQCDVYKDC